MKILITGEPGVGKTTLIKKIISSIDWPKTGFYTEEIREGGRRRGFKFTTLNGDEGVLAHIDFPGPMMVGRYGVRLDEFNKLAVPTIEEGINGRCLIVIDEIGKMELFSSRFQKVIEKAFRSDSNILATIGKFSHPLAQAIKNLPDVLMFELTLATRSALDLKIKHLLLEGEAR